MPSKNKMTNALTTNDAPAWQAELMQAAFNGVTSDDMKQIVAGIVKRAKDGSEKDVRLLFDYVLGGKGPKIVHQTVIVQEPANDSIPVAARPGSPEKLAAMQSRYANGKAIFHGEDG